eukprot:TRINITY_DN475_c0_g1_i1.p1 TRINITY_DN475_c0_g1~~TRINITY_DN475_c0_g1_i1.p1  ORF type:complete len:200 (-),score=42.73 TRINITY_DN475_c0_g1_i1:87-686(-)
MSKFENDIKQLIASGNWNQLALLTEHIELESSNEAPNAAAPSFYKVQLFTYLIINDLDSARFLWKRIPTEIRAAHPELGLIWKIGQAMWKREYANVYASLRVDWSPLCLPLANALTDQFRQRSYALICKAYTSISVNDAAIILGLAPSDVVTSTTAQGWKFDAATNMLSPKQISQQQIQKTGLDQLSSLTKYVVFLETK